MCHRILWSSFFIILCKDPKFKPEATPPVSSCVPFSTQLRPVLYCYSYRQEAKYNTTHHVHYLMNEPRYSRFFLARHPVFCPDTDTLPPSCSCLSSLAASSYPHR